MIKWFMTSSVVYVSLETLPVKLLIHELELHLLHLYLCYSSSSFSLLLVQLFLLLLLLLLNQTQVKPAVRIMKNIFNEGQDASKRRT